MLLETKPPIYISENFSNFHLKHSNPQSAFRVDAHDGQYGFVQYCISHVLGSLGVGSHLRKDVVHRLARVIVVLT